jgi:hypothetical protein
MPHQLVAGVPTETTLLMHNINQLLVHNQNQTFDAQPKPTCWFTTKDKDLTLSQNQTAMATTEKSQTAQ